MTSSATRARRTSSARAAARRRIRRCAIACGITEVDPSLRRSPVRALHLRRARRAARHRRRFRARAARGGDPVHLSPLWPRAHRHRRDRDLLSRPLGHPRGRQGVRPVGGHDRRALLLDLGHGRRRGARNRAQARRHRRGQPAHARKCARSSTTIQSFPRHLSQHVGGFVITRSRLDEVVPIGNGAMDDRTYVEWDKDDLDALGILKVDVLGLGMLTCIRKAFEFVEKHYGEKLTLATHPERRKRPSTACCGAPTRSACSRSRAARRCRCCRGSGRRNSTTSSSRSRSCGRARSRATWCIPICAGGRASRRSTIRRRSSKPCSARRSACRCSRSRR